MSSSSSENSKDGERAGDNNPLASPGNKRESIPADVTRFVVEGASHEESDDFEVSDSGDRQAGTGIVENGSGTSSHLQADGNSGVLGSIGDYLLLERIGAGGMGEVFRAEHRTMDRQVALKILPKSLSMHQELVERFYAEVRAIARLMHPNIVTAFDAGQQNGLHYLVMELIEGDVLSKRIQQRGAMSVNESVAILRQAASALDYAHRMGIIHRDIKPSNMMLNQKGILKLLDFGLAQLGKSTEQLSKPQNLVGTVEYMSPEQISRPDFVDGRSDLYSLGASLFFLMTGRSMFVGSPIQIAQGHLRQKPPALYEVRSDIDLRLDAVFQKLVAKDPNDRPPTAQALIDSLDRLNLQGSTVAGMAVRIPASTLSGDRPTSGGGSVTSLGRQVGPFAIDLGMLYSSAAIFDAKEGPKLITLPGGGELLRNMLWSGDDQIAVGADAAIKRQQSPERSFHGLQRALGTPQLDRPFAGKKVPPEVPIAAILRYLSEATRGIQPSSTHAVVTVPSSYGQMHRHAISTACQIAGLGLLQLLDRPLAAALSWLDVSTRLGSGTSARTAGDQVWLMVSLGGSGMEASVVKVEGTEVRLLATAGDSFRGTHRWQHLLAEHIVSLFKQAHGRDVRQDLTSATRLQRTVELTLERLAKTPKVEIRYESNQQTVQTTLTRSNLIEIAAEPVAALKDAIVETFKIAAIDPAEVDQILVMGGIARFEEMQAIIRGMLPHRPPIAVQEKGDLALGGAIQSQHMMPTVQAPVGLPRAISMPVYDLGILAPDTATGKTLPRILVPRGGRLPLTITRSLRAAPGADLPPYVQIIESTRLGSANWHRLGQVRLRDSFPLRAPGDPLQLKLQVNESGLLDASLLWPAGQGLVKFPVSAEAVLTNDQVERWQSWLETLLLCGQATD